MHKVERIFEDCLKSGEMSQHLVARIRGVLHEAFTVHSILHDEIHDTAWGLLAHQEIKSRFLNGDMTLEEYCEKMDTIFNNLIHHPLFQQVLPNVKKTLLQNDIDLSVVEDITEYLPKEIPSIY